MYENHNKNTVIIIHKEGRNKATITSAFARIEHIYLQLTNI